MQTNKNNIASFPSRNIMPLAVGMLFAFFVLELLRQGPHLVYIAREYFFIAPLSRTIPVMAIVLIALYLVLTFLHVNNSTRAISARTNYRLRMMMVLLCIGVFVLAPLATRIVTTVGTEVLDNSNIYDGAAQVGEAVNMFLSGKNPYQESFDMMFSSPSSIGFREQTFPNVELELERHPSYTHFAPLPAAFLLPAALYAPVKNLMSFFDVRILYGVLGIVLGALVTRAIRDTEMKLLFLIVFALNPFMVPLFLWGTADIFILFWIVAASMLLKRHPFLASLLIGVVIATKQIAWFFLPPLFFYYFLTVPKTTLWKQGRAAAARMLPALAVAMVSIAPFLWWDAGSFVEDVYRYVAGSAAASYPVSGYGLSSIFVNTGLISATTSTFPFGTITLAVGALMLIPLVRFLKRNPTPAHLLLAYALFGFVMSFLGRFFHSDMIMLYASLALISWVLMYGRDAVSENTPPPVS